ncbi:MAG TPA: NAD-dependent deacylase [Thermoanaerobaculia bacterium]|nr:NAD-dependent deacylase [Thermoanaerobaculia bacterium]
MAERLAGNPRLTVVTGAGVSAASGIPTFRGPGGLWRRRRPEELATPGAFDRDPALVWEWYAWRRELVAKAAPNRAHEVLAAWSRRFSGFHLVTQNVDGLHERAGTGNVVRFHGSLFEVSCRARCAASPRRWRHEAPFEELPPRCPHCGGLLRPAVVWFGEAIDPESLAAAEAALACDVFLVAGTSALVSPAAGLLDAAAARGAQTVEINPEATPASGRVGLAIEGRAEEVLDAIERRLRPS